MKGDAPSLLACGQFMTCPTDAAGANKDCSKAPRIVSNSWAGASGDTFFNAVVNSWRAAGIVPVFAIGNKGPDCGTANAPGDLATVIGVDATSGFDQLPSFSSKGPTTKGLVKPDIAAPGKDVHSASHLNPNYYTYKSGTSMATPHISGVIALLLSARPTLTFDELKSAMFTTAERAKLGPSGATCGGTPDSVSPNNQYGYGRVSASAALNNVLSVTPTPTPVSPVPVTPKPNTPAPSSPAPLTPAPVTPTPATPSPLTPAPGTPTPASTSVAPAPVTLTPATPAPTTPAPVPASSTPAPTTGPTSEPPVPNKC
ncbi:hypothetical protein Gpo141_00003742 [Globisporangium polare]